MGYKYYQTSITGSKISPKSYWTDLFYAFVDDQFEGASDVYTILEEIPVASGSMTETVVRLNRAISSITGKKLGDDYKQILFKEREHECGVGYKYYFDNNYWLTVQSEIIAGVARTVTARRCNSVLRWLDEYGNIYEEPCNMEYDINRPTDHSMGNNPVLAEGFIRLFVQLNSKTDMIKPGMRFLFGTPANRRCYKVYGDGILNFLNQETYDDGSSYVLCFIMGVSEVNEETDNVALGIADYWKVVYSISASPTSFSGAIGDSFLLTTNTFYNGDPRDFNVLQSISPSGIASVSGSIVTLNASGSCNVRSYMEQNPLVYADVPVIVSGSSGSPYFEIRVLPDADYIYETEDETFNVGLYASGSYVSDPFVFTILAGIDVPAENYVFSQTSGSTFYIKNVEKWDGDSLGIVCTSGSYERVYNVYLRGRW